MIAHRTPGSWNTTSRDMGITKVMPIKSADGIEIAYVPLNVADPMQTMANANTMASAPDVIHALTELCRQADERGCTHNICTMKNCALMRAAALLALLGVPA